MEGCLITFEGGEGSGKSTQLGHIADYLLKKGYPVIQTAEPGGTEVGKAIRALLLNGKHDPISSKAELLLYLADRAQHIEQVVRPALKDRKVILCDRFTDSTLIYQGYARGIDFSEMKSLLSFAADAVVPDLTLLLDIDVEKGLLRLKKRAEINRFDREPHAFHQKVRQGYLALAKQGPSRIRLIFADQTELSVFETIKKEVDALLP